MKNILLFLIVVVGLGSCASEGAPKEPVKEPIKKVVQEEAYDDKNIELVDQYFDLFNKHEWDKMAEMYIEVADFKDPSYGDGLVKQTRLATSAKFQEMIMEYPDLKREVIKKYPSENNSVVVELVSTGTAKDGTKMKLPMRTIFTFQNGKITKDFSEYGE